MKARGGRTVWLASYPKSGNTWLRAILTALGTHPHLFGVDHLGYGAQPHHVGAALSVYGLDPRYLNNAEIDQLRTALVLRADGLDADGAPLVRKTHEWYRGGPVAAEPFPRAATRAAILLVRDPRDVACSYASFFGVTIDRAVDAMGRDGGEPDPSAARMQTAQPWGTWSTHAQSWLADGLPFPVHLVRYEDLLTDAHATLTPILAAIGLDCSPEQLRAAVTAARFDSLQESESQRGFRETSRRTETFFRRGITGGWRDTLSDAQVAAVEADHGPTMEMLGYEPVSAAAVRAALKQSRDSSRRQSRRSWLELPDSLGLHVHEADLPDELSDAERPRPWIQVTPRQVLIRLRPNTGLLVSDGVDVAVDFTPGPETDAGGGAWLLQGWGVTLAMLQRGMLSLHAATVEVRGKVIALAGHRAAGKSTTAMGLRGRGHTILCDDVTLIEFRPHEAWTTPYSRNVHLLEDAAEALGVDFATLPPLASRRLKAAFLPEDPSTVPRRIDSIVVLKTSPEATVVSKHHPVGAARMSALLGHASRDGIAPLILGQERYFAQVAQLADLVPITVVSRPASDWTLDAVLDAIEAEA